MLHLFDFAREMSFLGVTVRMLSAVLCGGAVGLEREFKRRPAGFRTHILICLGASITILTNLYLYQVMHLYTDISRLGAQVIAGIGFVGAGTIIVTGKQRVKGLTTAAGLWTCSIIGLACGAGYAECAIFTTLLVLFAEFVLVRIEYRFARTMTDVNVYVEYGRVATIQQLVRILRAKKIPMNDMEVNRIADGEDQYHYGAILTLRGSPREIEEEVIQRFNAIEDVMVVEEL
jgi:putative Mg2+ transporter-C (MgtC) family protein